MSQILEASQTLMTGVCVCVSHVVRISALGCPNPESLYTPCSCGAPDHIWTTFYGLGAIFFWTFTSRSKVPLRDCAKEQDNHLLSVRSAVYEGVTEGSNLVEIQNPTFF